MKIFKPDNLVTLILAIMVLNGTNGRLVQFMCGRSFRVYNPLTQECINGQVYHRGTLSTTAAITTPRSSNIHEEPISVQSQSPKRLPRRTCRGSEDLLDCNGKLYCGRNLGYKCCGFEVYQPRNQTCCQQSSVQYKIHDKPARKHICCKLDVYERGDTNTTCQHPSANDKLFQVKSNRPSKLVAHRKICKDANYVYRILITRQRKRKRLTATVGVWAWPPVRMGQRKRMDKKPTREVQMDIKLDRYSPNKDVTKKTFLVFSRYQHLKNAVFFLRPDDVVYKCPKSYRKLVQKLMKFSKQCIN